MPLRINKAFGVGRVGDQAIWDSLIEDRVGLIGICGVPSVPSSSIEFGVISSPATDGIGGGDMGSNA